MADLIDRQAAINAIGNIPDYDDGMVFEALSHAIRDIALLPSAQRWIPVTERLPETPIRVQVQLDNSWIITAYYDEGEWHDVPGDGEPIYGVLAWMSLPEPWKE